MLDRTNRGLILCLAAARSGCKSTDKANSEVRRQSVAANLRNALAMDDGLTKQERKRVERLLRSLDAGAAMPARKKVELLRDSVLPAIETL
jgi:hypothetical protein